MWHEGTCPNGDQILFGLLDQLLAFLFRHAGDIGDEGGHAWIMLKKISMDIEEAPVECIPEFTPGTFLIITHFQNIPGS